MQNEHPVRRDDEEPDPPFNPLQPEVGQVGINIEGEPTIGLGGGLAVDVVDGDISIGGVEIG